MKNSDYIVFNFTDGLKGKAQDCDCEIHVLPDWLGKRELDKYIVTLCEKHGGFNCLRKSNKIKRKRRGEK